MTTTESEKKLSASAMRALIVARELVCPGTDIHVKNHKDLGFIWSLIYWGTFIITFGKVKMTTYGFVLGSSMFVRDASTITAELVFHEADHMRQREQHGKICWYINYLFLFPTLVTMRSFYERDAYTVSAIVDSMNRATSFDMRKGYDPYKGGLYERVRKYAYTNIDWYLRTQFFGWGYFFMALFRGPLRKKMQSNVNAALALLFGDADYKYTDENNRFLNDTNIVDAIRAYYK